MTQTIRSGDGAGVAARGNLGAISGAAVTANAMIADNRGPTFDAQGLARDLAAARLQSPASAATLEAAVVAQLTPREQGELLRVQTAPAVTAQAAPSGPSTAETVADLTQMALDLVGIIEPTPFADGSNAVISLGRSIGSAVSGDWSGAGGHLLNGGLSVAGVLPYLGDAAKVGKIGKWAQTVSDAVSMVARNPASRAAVEAPLREIRDLIGRIPQGAIDALPASARESLGRMKTQLDEFFGIGARAADTRLVGGAENIGQTVTINGRQVEIGQAPATTRAADGTPRATNAAGDEVNLRQPATYDSRITNADSTVTYERAGMSVRYDANGFPLFNSQAEVFLPADKIVVGSRSTHFSESNRILARSGDDQLRAAGFNDADIAKLRNGDTPDNYTWHHHQDVGRMQLVRTSEHDHFRGGHSGGWSLWGDAARFR